MRPPGVDLEEGPAVLQEPYLNSTFQRFAYEAIEALTGFKGSQKPQPADNIAQCVEEPET